MKLPLLTVMITTYNASAFIRETIDSVLCQTFDDFELLVGDDASSDDTCDIIESYGDSRIRLIRCSHDFIGTENRLLYEAKGKYIARLDHDDRMLPDRLRIQYEYMESHPEIDALGGAAVCFGGSREKFKVWAGHKFTVSDFLRSNFMVNPSSMLRRESILNHKIKYKRRYLYADDYGFWADMLKAGLHLENIPDILVEYRVSSKQTSVVHADIQAASVAKVVGDLEEWASRQETEWALAHAVSIPNTGNRLTLIIPFLNEGEEVARTVASVRRHAGGKVDIIVINDHSTDGYDYRGELAPYGVAYIYNTERKGVAASRDLGVRLCKTSYFLLLDAHMRFYDNKWRGIIEGMLDADDRQLLCAQTRVLRKKNGRVFAPRMECKYYGAYIPFSKNNFIPDIDWNVREHSPGSQTEEIAVVLGAGYAASTRYWKYLRGLEGLRFYGCDEDYISIKVWLEGGRCVLLKNVVIGHVYRESAPYRGISVEYVYNYLMISYTLFPVFLRCWSYAIALKKDFHTTKETLRLINSRKAELDDMRRYYNGIFTRRFDNILQLNAFCEVGAFKDCEEKLRLLHKIARHVRMQPVKAAGINHGRMGQIIFLTEYERFTGYSEYGETARDWLGSMLREIESGHVSADASFADGLAGIGWGLLYLRQEYNIAVEKQLELIDRGMENSAVAGLNAYDFFSGVGGVCCYVGARIAQCRASNMPLPFAGNFVNGLLGSMDRMVSPPSDMQTMVYAMFLKALRDNPHESGMRLSVSHWTECRDFLPKDESLWQEGIGGCAGYGMMIINRLNKKQAKSVTP